MGCYSQFAKRNLVPLGAAIACGQTGYVTACAASVIQANAAKGFVPAITGGAVNERRS